MRVRFDALVVIGPSGNGKSTLGQAIATRLGWRFIEGDKHHPPANIAKMARGEPLTDADREPFLDSIGSALAADGPAVAACSALKRTYRKRLLHVAQRPLLFVLPRVPEEELRQRMRDRSGHYMPASLLGSQLSAFEPLGEDEAGLVLDGTLKPGQFAELVAQFLGGGT